MSDKNYKKLILRYADGRTPCNCGNAYYSNCGVGSRNGVDRNDMPVCKYGCSSNLISAKEEMADRVCKEFSI